MKLEVGKTYRARNGELVKIISVNDEGLYSCENLVYDRFGLIHGLEKLSKRDLIELVEELPVKEETSGFKVGDKVFDVLSGAVFIATEIVGYDGKHLALSSVGGSESCSMLNDGRKRNLDKYPRFISLSQARAKGYDVPVTKCKKSNTVKVMYHPKRGTYEATSMDATPNDGVLVKEVTFEWEEDEV